LALLSNLKPQNRWQRNLKKRKRKRLNVPVTLTLRNIPVLIKNQLMAMKVNTVPVAHYVQTFVEIVYNMEWKEISDLCRSYLVEILGSAWQVHLIDKPQAYKEWDFLIFHFAHESAKKYRGMGSTWTIKQAIKADFKEFIISYLYDKIGGFNKYNIGKQT
jgi:hypothetical protein